MDPTTPADASLTGGPLSGTPGSYRQWLTAAAEVLRRSGKQVADLDTVPALLGRETVEGLPIPPLGVPPLKVPPSGVVGAPGTDGPDGPATARTAADWDVRTLVAERDPATAGRASVIDLENGATSLWWAVGDRGTAPADLGTALGGVLLDAAPVVLLPTGQVDDLTAARALAGVLRERGVRPAPGTSLGADPIGRALLDGRADQGRADQGRADQGRADQGGAVPVLDHLPELIDLAGNAGVGALVADGTVAHRCGAGDAVALGYALSVGTAYLRALVDRGVPMAQAFSMLQVRLAVTDEQFVGTAALRAAYRLWSRVGEIVGADPWASGLTLHAVTSWPMMTATDPWVNLMRTTVAAFAAAVGGAHAVTVLPFDLPLGVPDALGRRMAVAQSLVLMREAHVGQVQDPAAGAFALEQLTTTLAEAAWAEFQRLEAAGGAVAALRAGAVDQGFAAAREERARRLATRRQPLTGVTEFPSADPPPTRPAGDPLFPRHERWAAPFEDLRAAPPVPPVVLVDLGGSAVRRGWIENLLLVGGLGHRDRPADSCVGSPLDGAVVILVGSDERYAQDAAERIADVRAAGARRVVLAGRPSPEVAALVDDRIAAGSDVLAFLRRTRDAAACGAFTPGAAT